MSKIIPIKPFLILLYGFPGSGKTYFARQFSDSIQVANLQSDRIRGELFEEPRYDKQENAIVTQLMNYMTEEFAAAGVSVIYDADLIRAGQRKQLINMALKYRVQPLTVWFQMDEETAFYRNVKRDRRHVDDKYSAQWDRTNFDEYVAQMQNPKAGEEFTVVSGKHLFKMQQSSVIAKLRSLNVVTEDDSNSKVIKPGMVNLIPNASGRVDMSRRNISIRH